MRPALEQLNGKQNLVGAEVGVWEGTNAKDMLDHLNIKRLYLVDPYKLYDYFSHMQLTSTTLTFGTGVTTDEELIELRNKEVNKYCEGERIAKEKLKPFENIVWINKMSYLAAQEIEDESLDFVYIDGNHEYKYVLQDIEAWTPKVKKGGLVGGHDIKIANVSSAIVKYVIYRDISFKIKTPDWWFFRENI